MKSLITMTKILALLSTWMALPGCACFKPEHRNDPGCAVLHQIVDCTTAEVQSLLPQFKPIVKALIEKATGGDGKIDWSAVETTFIALGIKDGGCILADLQNDFVTPAVGPQASPALLTAHMKAKASHDSMADYRAKRWPNTKFKLKSKEGKQLIVEPAYPICTPRGVV